ncbi:MAG: HD-GYP domain-containing protein [Methylomonas sp.]|nr:HD-GYP domain-containing protein [Methylomonas sp.]
MTSLPAKAHLRDLLHTLYSMAFLVEARDPYTGGHLWRVSQYAMRLALAAGWSKQGAVTAGLGGFLHDLGKVGVPDSILKYPGKLNEAELAVMRTHPSVGGQVLQGHPLAAWVMAAVLGHHERMDGKGYPYGLNGERIAETARIVSIADAFDAMTSTRPYRTGIPVAAAIEQIEDNLDTQFDGYFGRRFVELARSGELDGIIGHSDSGIPLHECPMCGPVVVARKLQQAGDSVFCRVCGNGFVLDIQQGKPALLPALKKGGAADLQAEIDHDLLTRQLEDALPYLPTLPTVGATGKNWLKRLRFWG